MNTKRESFKPFPHRKPDHLRLCYVYTEALTREDSMVLRYDHETEEWCDIYGDDVRLEDGIMWAHIPLPNEYKPED